MNSLTSEKSLNEVIELYNMCFNANSLFDRIAYVLSINFNEIKFGDWFHHEISHLMTGDKFADGIEAFGELRGDLFYRDSLPKHKEIFELVSQSMESAVLMISEIEKQTVFALKTCAENGDEGFEDYLRDFNVKNISPLLKQLVVFYRATLDYEKANDIHKWNNDFKKYIISEFQGGD